MNRAEVINKIILKDKPEVRDKYTFDWRDILSLYGRVKTYGQEIVKEFAEYLITVYSKEYDNKQTMVSQSFESERVYDFWFYKGQLAAIQQLVNLLDKNIKDFIKEQNNE